MENIRNYILTQLPDRPAPYLGNLQRRWTLLDDEGKGWLISYVDMPECMAFPYADGKVTRYEDQYVNHCDTPDEALADILAQMADDGIHVVNLAQ